MPGNADGPRPQDSKTRGTITLRPVALLALTVIALLAMVAVGLISGADEGKCSVIVATLVPLVSAAIPYCIRSKGNGDE